MQICEDKLKMLLNWYFTELNLCVKFYILLVSEMNGNRKRFSFLRKKVSSQGVFRLLYFLAFFSGNTIAHVGVSKWNEMRRAEYEEHL